MRSVVLASHESPDGTRCVDIRREAGGFGWVECRRDPEDPHGWRPLDGGTGPTFADAAAAEADARAGVAWMA